MNGVSGGGGGGDSGTGRSIVTYIKIPISRLLITSTVYHAKQGEVSILQTGWRLANGKSRINEGLK